MSQSENDVSIITTTVRDATTIAIRIDDRGIARLVMKAAMSTNDQIVDVHRAEA